MAKAVVALHIYPCESVTASTGHWRDLGKWDKSTRKPCPSMPKGNRRRDKRDMPDKNLSEEFPESKQWIDASRGGAIIPWVLDKWK